MSTRITHRCLVLLIPGIVAGQSCNGGGASSTNGSTAGTAAGGESTAGASGSAGMGMGGADNPSPGGAGSGGASASAGAQNTPNDGGLTDAGVAGSANGGRTGSDGGPVSSTGCGKASPQTGTLRMTVQANDASYIVSIPGDYRETHPYPLGFAFHGRDRTGAECQQGDCIGFQTVMSDKAILVYMTSLGGTGWELDGERELNVAFFSQVLAQMKADYCVDEHRIFVAGTSSGANFTNILGCRFGNQLLAVAPVAGAMLEQTCSGPVAALLIHGVDDYHVPFADGQAARDFYAALDGCSSVTQPPIADIHASVVANRESHLCASYQGCGARFPVTWCEHSEGGYDGSTHGWPTFGGQQIWDFISSLP